jgi:hypothetical protein
MKKNIAILILSLFVFTIHAQTKLSDVNRIVLNTYVPVQAEPLPDQAKSLLENKLSQIASNYGMGGSAINPRFVLMVNTAVVSKDIIAGPPQMLSYNLELTLFIADAIDLKKFANTTIEIKGVGTNETKAYIEAIKNINVKNKEIASFIEDGKNKIIDMYNTQCDFIIKDAESYSKKGEYDAAMLKLASVPDVCEKCYVSCMDKMNEIYQQKIDKECLLIMRDAKTSWMANQNSIGAEKVAQIINSISPFSTCEPDAGNLMNEIQAKLAKDEKAKWDFQIQKHKDAVKLKQEALRIDEEHKKEALRIDEEDKKRQAYNQKDAQKQQYALQKADQEAGGFRGFVNSISKLKMTLWRDNSNEFIKNNNVKVDYSKIK